jgi:hypothetical protein
MAEGCYQWGGWDMGMYTLSLQKQTQVTFGTGNLKLFS